MDQQPLKDLRILVIEKSDVIQEALRVAFAQSEGCHVVGMATELNDALRLLIKEQPDVVLMDVSPAHPSVELLRGIRKIDQGVIIIIFTAENSSEIRIACRQAGATFYLVKWQLRDLLDLLRLVRRLT